MLLMNLQKIKLQITKAAGKKGEGLHRMCLVWHTCQCLTHH
jgi:hypothetical protein